MSRRFRLLGLALLALSLVFSGGCGQEFPPMNNDGGLPDGGADGGGDAGPSDGGPLVDGAADPVRGSPAMEPSR
jgi:hypothetical protein